VALDRPDLSILERDKRVHHVIGLAGGNIVQILMTNFYEDFFYEFGHLYFENDTNIARSEAFHQDIYHAIREQNAGVARDIMRDVLQYAEQAICREIKRDAEPRPIAAGETPYTGKEVYWSNQ
jgi:DNA-binding FadR family transcriptional regulator